jgi:sterol desaturase/sphingolipid hydroxylase (fatty acid hydroxylase superfamily)
MDEQAAQSDPSWFEAFLQWFVDIGSQMVDMAGTLLVIGLPFLLLTEILKRLPDSDRHNFKLAHRERPFFNKEFTTELAFPIFGTFLMMPLEALRQYFVYEAILTPYFPFQIFDEGIQSWPLWVQVIVGLTVLDFSLYVRHWFVHKYFWPYHTIHHAAREITWLTWIRLHPIDMFVMGLIDATILFVLGFSGEAFAIAVLIKDHMNRFNHSNIQLDYPSPLRYILVSPNMHRWHHAADDVQAQNKNFAIVWAWLDLLFGTYYVPEKRLPTRYGVIDDEGNDVAGPSYVDQLLYPFRHHVSWVRERLGRRAQQASPEPQAAEPGGE